MRSSISIITSPTTSLYTAREFISFECPRQCIAIYGSSRLAAVGSISASARPPLTSLIIEAPASTALRATSERIVSILIRTPD